MSKRQCERYTRRLETIFTTATDTFKGITSDISEGGLFIRTAYALAPGSIIGIEVRLPDGIISRLKGRVKRSIRNPLLTAKNGMGIEIIEKDLAYMNLVMAMREDGNGNSKPITSKSTEHEFSILVCQNCGAKNKVKAVRSDIVPKCGKCGHPLTLVKKSQQEYLILICSKCKAKNKVSRERLSLNPRCGKCGTALRQ